MERFDAIVALGGGVDSAGNPTSCSRARTRRAAELYFGGLAPVVIFSGKWSRHLRQPPPRTEAEAMAEAGLELGVPRGAIKKESESSITLGNFYHLKTELAVPLGYRALAVVTSPSHIARCRIAADSVLGPGFQVEFFPTAERLFQVTEENQGCHDIAAKLQPITPGDHQAVAEVFPEILAA